MLSIYRVISLSLLMSLFFAAPLLCVHPISIQQQKAHALAAKRQKAKSVTVAWQTKHLSPADRVAGSLRQADFVGGQSEKWNEDDREDWDGVDLTVGTGGVKSISHSSIYQ